VRKYEDNVFSIIGEDDQKTCQKGRKAEGVGKPLKSGMPKSKRGWFGVSLARGNQRRGKRFAKKKEPTLDKRRKRGTNQTRLYQAVKKKSKGESGLSATPNG